MFGYRLIRDADFLDLRTTTAADRQASQTKIDAQTEKIEALLRENGTLKAQAASRAAMYDLIVTRVNLLEHDNATLRNKVTGLPTLVPSIGKGSPIDSASLGAGVDLFADVGDDEAMRLRHEGILHDEGVQLPPAPSAADLAPGGDPS
jgi:hypothetical protein